MVGFWSHSDATFQKKATKTQKKTGHGRRKEYHRDTYLISTAKMIYNAKNRIRANRIQKAQNLIAIALIYGLLLIAGHVEYKTEQLERIAYAQP